MRETPDLSSSKFTRTVLFIAGLAGIGIGTALLIAPVAFQASSGVDIGGSTSLLNENRGIGGVLLLAGIGVLVGAFTPRLALASAALGAVFYLGYGLARLLSVVLDGLPSSTLVAAMVAELILGSLLLGIALRLRRPAGALTA
jgi:hypothetical protein